MKANIVHGFKKACKLVNNSLTPNKSCAIKRQTCVLDCHADRCVHNNCGRADGCTGQTSLITQPSLAAGFDRPCLRTRGALTTLTVMDGKSEPPAGIGGEGERVRGGLIRMATEGKQLGGERGGKGMKRVDAEEEGGCAVQRC